MHDAWDTSRDVVSAMGDRFVTVRGDSTAGREASARQAIGNTGKEVTMRAELAQVVGGLIASVDLNVRGLTDYETERLTKLANIVTLARTGVERDYRGDIVDGHAPEMPTRLAKQVAQLVRGAMSLGMGEADAMRLATRWARDSMEPRRRDILLDLIAHPYSTAEEVESRIVRPLTTIKRELVALHVLRLLICEERDVYSNGRTFAQRRYAIAPTVDQAVLLGM
jgi:hypothetical protein